MKRMLAKLAEQKDALQALWALIQISAVVLAVLWFGIRFLVAQANEANASQSTATSALEKEPPRKRSG